MALSNPRPLYGIHSVSPYSRTDGSFYGILKVLEGSSLNLAGSLVKLEGGSQPYPFAVESGAINAEIALKVGEYPDFLYTLFLGNAPSASGSSATGSVSTLTNKLGTSVMKATTGIASAGITPTTGAANLKFGKYVVKAASATTVDVYFSSDADMSRGTAGTYQDDLLKITATPLTVTASVPVSVPNFGVDLTGGSGTIGMTVGDTATFEVLPPSNKSMSVKIGGAADSFPEFGMICMAQKTGNKQMTELDVFRCKGSGMPLGLQAKAFGKTDIKVEAFYDSSQDGVFKERWIEET
jgi:hypothetical protein